MNSARFIRFMGGTVGATLALCCATYAAAQPPPSLSGPNVITLPRVDVPFIWSEMLIQQGTRDPITGGCTFEVNLAVEPGELEENQKKARIQRAYDPDTCQELIESGVIIDERSSAPKLSPYDILRLSDLKAITLPQSGATAPSAAAAVAQYSAFAEVSYTDGNNPFVKPLRSLTNGIEVSHGNASIDLTTGDCQNTAPFASYQYESYWFSATGWSQPNTATSLSTLSCSQATAQLTAKHQNSSSIPFLFDCSSVVYINYSPLKLTLNFSGSRQLGGSVTVSGDMSMCGEYLARFETLQ